MELYQILVNGIIHELTEDFDFAMVIARNLNSTAQETISIAKKKANSIFWKTIVILAKIR